LAASLRTVCADAIELAAMVNIADVVKATAIKATAILFMTAPSKKILFKARYHDDAVRTMNSARRESQSAD
jgi:hypothetical protein